MRPKVLIGHAIKAEKLAGKFPEVDFDCIPSNENKYDLIKSMISKYDGLLAIGHPVDSDLLKLGDKLKIVANCAVGYDNIDAVAAKSMGIAVSNTPDSTTASTADFTLGLIISLLRNISLTDRWLREGDKIPYWGHRSVMGDELGGKLIGIVGMGRIGKAVAKRAQAFGMNVVYFKRTRLTAEEEIKLDVTYSTMDDLLQHSDLVSIHTPLNDETRGMIDASSFAKMKPGSYFINTARGGIIDEQALIDALQSGHLAGAGLDVFVNEPHIPEALLKMDNVVLAPHNGTGTQAARDAMFDEAMGNIIAFLTGGEMTSRIV